MSHNQPNPLFNRNPSSAADEVNRSQASRSIDYEYVSVPVLVIGAGAAGARTAIELTENGMETLVIGKRDHGDAHTTWAAGGINAALGNLDSDDDWRIHAADTLKEGHFVNDPMAVETVTKAMPDRLHELARWGTPFDRTDDGRINQRYFGAQSFRRTAFVGDRTGEALLDTLIKRAKSLNIPYRENVLVTELLADDNRVYGAVAVNLETAKFILFEAAHVVLAAGGYSALYGRHSSRDDENTADGPALAYRAGANLLDLEFVQFHPTGMVGDRYSDEWDGRLVTEAVRGEGGRLYNSDGERFMERYSPNQLELDARDVVARAIATEISEGRGTDNGGVYLDISHRDAAFIRERLPRMYERFQRLGVDISKQPIEVAPTAHYSMGGVDIDWTTGRTAVDRLYAVGETTAGVHGANRLGGNSLAETVVMGKVVGEHIVDLDAEMPTMPNKVRAHAERVMHSLVACTDTDGDVSPSALIADLRGVMDEHAGIIRDAETLWSGFETIREIRDRTTSLRIEGGLTSDDFELAVDLSFMLTVTEGVLRGALKREESRGAHFRSDFPETHESWRQNILYTQTDTGPALWHRDVARPTPEIESAIDEGYELEYHLLE
ncbi:L-aspartate oxidase [Haladaptatus pallidirubidus]|nr:FAD-dependent oxidoreductase [Haladaptatus pallidirubidus]